jgi:PST family polysaccharide transporter
MSIAQRAASGAAWNIVTSLGTRVLQVVGTLALAHYLSPDEYGTVIGASIVTGTCLTFTQFGLPQYLVVKPDAGPEVAFHVTFYTVSACLLALGVMSLAQGWMASFFHVEDLGRYFPWLAAAAVAECLSIVPERLLSRDLRFRLVALTRSAGDLVFAFSSVALAMAGQGGMSLIYAGLLRVGVRLAVYSVKLDVRAWAKPCALSWAATREMFAFGLPLSVSVIAGTLSVRWDNMVFSHYFGAGTMGAYNYAYSLSEMPVVQVGEQIGDVLLPSFARMAPDERRRALGRSMALLGIVVFPLAVGLAAVADSLVRSIFDAKWSGITPILTVLAVLAVTRPISYVVSSYLQASGRVVIVSVLEVVKVAILFTLMVLAAPSGILLVCAAVGGAFLFQSLAGLVVVTRAGLPFGATLLRIARPLFATVPMAAAVVGVRLALARAGLRTAPVSLALEILTGAVVYVVSAFAIAGDTAREIVSLARSVLARRRGEGA